MPAFHRPPPMNPTAGPSMAASRPARFLFWLAAITALLNLNHASNLLAGMGWPFTVGLALCCAFLCLAVHVPARWALGAPGFLFLTTLTSYLFIGLGVVLLTGDGLDTMDYRLPGRVGIAILIVTAIALGASAILQRFGVESLLKGILAILAVACIFVLLSPWLSRYYSLSHPHLTVAVHSINAGRFTGIFATPHGASITACYTVVLALSLLLGGRSRPFAIPVALLGGAAVFLTFTRTGFVTLALILLFFLGISASRLRFRRAFIGWPLTIIALITGAFTLVIVNLEPLAEHFAFRMPQIHRLGLGYGAEELYFRRASLWSLGLSQIVESPLFGHGLDRFHFLDGAPDCQQVSVPCGVHNTYLMLWGEAGILPLALLLFFIGSVLWKWWTLPKSVPANAGAGCTLVFAVECMTIDGSLYFIGHCFMLGVACAVMAQAARESRGPRPARTLPTPAASVRTTMGGIAPSGAG